MTRIYVINLDRSPERWDLMGEVWSDYELVRVPAIDARDLSDAEARDFQIDSSITPGQMADRTSLAYWRKSLAIYKSHLLAIDAGLCVDDQFMVMEDDARPRESSFDFVRYDPGAVNDGVIIWGGALKQGGYSYHHRMWRDFLEDPLGEITWHRIRNWNDARNRYQATAYEFTSRQAAERWANAVEANPESYDIAWWSAMLEVPTVVPSIELIYQDLAIGPARRRKHREMLIAEGVAFGPWS